MSLWRTFFLFLVQASILSATEVQISLKFEPTKGTFLEGSFLVPSLDGSIQEIQPVETIDKEDLKVLTWNTTIQGPGVCRFFVSNTLANGEFSDWSGNQWLDYAEVTVKTPEKTWKSKPPSGSGAIWYVCDIIGETGTLLSINTIAPRSGALYGHVSGALSGLRLPQFPVTRAGETISEYDNTSSLGMFLFFPQDTVSVLKFERPGYISVEETISHSQLKLPPRIDVNLTPVMDDDTWRLVLTWMNYPEDLDIQLSGTTPEGEDFVIGEKDKRSFKGWARLDLSGRRGFDAETMTVTKTDGAPYLVKVKSPQSQSGEDYRLSYSQAKVRVFKGKSLVKTFNVPQGKDGRQWDVCRIEVDGSLEELNSIKP